ncbi:hypothetical protein BKA80DRAFT_275714 [Phyllosticta citrichinensis]
MYLESVLSGGSHSPTPIPPGFFPLLSTWRGSSSLWIYVLCRSTRIAMPRRLLFSFLARHHSQVVHTERDPAIVSAPRPWWTGKLGKSLLHHSESLLATAALSSPSSYQPTNRFPFSPCPSHHGRGADSLERTYLVACPNGPSTMQKGELGSFRRPRQPKFARSDGLVWTT